MKRFLMASAVGIGLMLGVSGSAMADFIFQLDTGNTSGTTPLSGFPGPYIQIDIQLLDPTHAKVTATSDTNSTGACSPSICTYLMGGEGMLGLNTNGTVTLVGGLGGVAESNSLAGFTPGPASNVGSGNEDGWGSFNFSLDNFDGFTHSATSVIFTLQLTSGTWAADTDVLKPNAQGSIAAGHVFVTNPNCTGACTTGFAAGTGGSTPPQNIPEPGILSLLAIGLLGLGGVRAKRRWSRVVLPS